MRIVFFEPDRWARLMYPRTLWFLLGLLVLLVLISVLVRIKATYPLDLRATLRLQRWSSPIADVAMRWFTWMGNSLTMIVLAAACAIFAAIAQDLRAALFILLSLLALPINVLLKNSFDRQRPGEEEVKVHPGPRWGYSYPSGHAMGSTAFYGFLAIMIFLHVPQDALRAALMIPFVLLPVLVSISRVYMGAHWLSDVVGGMAGGTMLITLLAVLYPV